MKKIGYTHMRVKIVAGEPLRPRVLIKGKRVYFGNNLHMRTSHRSAIDAGGWVIPMGVANFWRGGLVQKGGVLIIAG